MALPFFYIPFYDPAKAEITLDEDNSRHIVQVLRMKPGEALRLTDGKGSLLTAEIVEDHKKKCLVEIRDSINQPSRKKKISIAISLLKNAHRFEWFLEKATEIGVMEIIPLLCERTEKQHIRQDRFQHILVSAMLQSQQAWLPVLQAPAPFSRQIGSASQGQRMIAHCVTEEKSSLAVLANSLPASLPADASGASSPYQDILSKIILIGPEGDFTPAEIEEAMQNGFIPVTLGETRLRAETAGIVAAALLCQP
jgi:16S rRNA (uracil1498-N3)-methyltransferase